jgi:ribokinase
LRDWGPANFVESLRDVSVLFANEEEDAVLAPHLVGRDIDRVITRGAAGARYDGAEGTYEVPAREVTVIDTTGAGDAATGAFIAARLLGLDVESSLAMAMDRAAEVIGRLGA